MKRAFVCAICFLFYSGLYANIIFWPYLPAGDYFRGTTGERLFFNPIKQSKGDIVINNDFRYYRFKHYRDITGGLKEYPTYSRFINIVSIGYMPSEKFMLSLRMPYVGITMPMRDKTEWGISDFLVSGVLQIFTSNCYTLSISSGLKLPVGYYKFGKQKITLGTGSYDVPIILYSDVHFKDFCFFFDTGYIFTGKSDNIFPFFNNIEKIENGNEIFFDAVLTKEIKMFTAKFETNYYYVFDTTPDILATNEGQQKLTLAPGIVFPLFIKDLKIDASYLFDVTGENVFYR